MYLKICPHLIVIYETSNKGNIYFDNSTLILESDDTARLINNGCITLKSSFMIGKGIIFNNGRLNAVPSGRGIAISTKSEK